MSSKLQRLTTLAVLGRTAAGLWYRAGDDPAHGSPAGERVTLASLFAAGLLVRRAWRGEDGAASAAYEYQASPDLLAQAKEGDLLVKVRAAVADRDAYKHPDTSHHHSAAGPSGCFPCANMRRAAAGAP